MGPRHGQSPRSLPVVFFAAAAQLDLPKAVVRASMDRADPNRSFAARLIDVSHADEPDGCTRGISARTDDSPRNGTTLRRSSISRKRPFELCLTSRIRTGRSLHRARTSQLRTYQTFAAAAPMSCFRETWPVTNGRCRLSQKGSSCLGP